MREPTDHGPASESELDPALRDWLTHVVGEVELVRPLIGGITAEMLQLRRRDGGGDLVVRRWSEEFPGAEGHVRRETDALRALVGGPLPVPELLAADPQGASAGCPTTVTTFLPGAVRLDPSGLRDRVRRLAGMLARIHAAPLPALEPVASGNLPRLSWLEAGEPGLARAAARLAARPADPARKVLVHGDYQHFNVLWSGQRVSAVVDWPNAGVGDRGIDVGHCRLNLAVLHGADAAMWFLEDYEAAAGVRVDPAADVRHLMGFGPDWPEFIPVQVAGRAPVDGPGMAGRVRETLERTLRRAG